VSDAHYPHIDWRRLLVVIFVEGFCSLGAEVIALRQIVPHLGSAIVVTAPTIGFFLLALALGYQAGARVADGFVEVVRRNFLLSAALAGIGLVTPAVAWLFDTVGEPVVAYLFFVLGVLCPLAFWLGQTVPVLTNVMRHERAGQKSGTALYWSTLGSFLGAVSLSLVVMQTLGLTAAVACVVVLLLAGALALSADRRTWLGVALAAAVGGAGLAIGWRTPVIETAYAHYAVKSVDLPGREDSRAFMVNRSPASILSRDADGHLHYARYIEHMRRILTVDLGFAGRDILVLGAGGFTLGHREPTNRYVYVDIDPQIRSIAEKSFLREKADGEFIVDDARRFAATTERRFAAVVVDVFSNRLSIPGHLVTREFWVAARRPLADDGVLLANLILDPALGSDYARNVLATVESVFGRCAVEVLQKHQALANVVVLCRKATPGGARIYVDERSGADIDAVRMEGGRP
jgi:predicted membrane-bound spermidine synthase